MNLINDILWTYILIAMLLGCAIWFTIKTRFVQFRMIGEMLRLLKDSAGKGEHGEKHISSFQAFAISLASRVGTGNLAGVATAIAIGGPGAIFWMWIIALIGGASSFIESTLAQIYKVKDENGAYRGGPAYYIEKGLNKKIKWLCNARVTLDYETMVYMKKAGCSLIIPGIESGSQELLNNMKKGTKISQIEEYVKNAKKAGLLIHACYMVGNKIRK